MHRSVSLLSVYEVRGVGEMEEVWSDVNSKITKKKKRLDKKTHPHAGRFEKLTHRWAQALRATVTLLLNGLDEVSAKAVLMQESVGCVVHRCWCVSLRQESSNWTKAEQ